MSAQTEVSSSEVPSTGFIARVSSIPLIHDSVSTLHSYAKDNKYSRYALESAGSAVETVNKYTEPYQTRLQPHISKVDQIANKSLDLLETTFPIVTKPTSEVVAQVKKPIEDFQSTIDAHVTLPVKVTAATVAATVNTHATPLVDGFETIVNRILPADVEAESSTTGQSNQATRVVDITRNASLRVSRRVSIGAAPIVQSAQNLRQAAENNTALVKSKESINALNIRLNILVDALRQHAKELQENVQKVPGEASQRVHALSGSVLAEIESLSTFLKEHSPKLPESVQVRLEPLVGFVNDRYETVKGEMAKSDVSAVQKARNILHLTTEETLPILQSAAQDVKETLLQYQITLQSKVHEVNHSVTETLQTARVTLVGAK
ncbi:hypothetical protein B0O80DRAFT_503902 [Mortierella sp. GBAus27b]|nr:hypothetical protein BGX31_003816 [Mortierella sp. GBA43]KAI8345936.1 hypothetical protein B0O80DRAFT_503902 [Mortierella sp. GBAus27b]